MKIILFLFVIGMVVVSTYDVVVSICDSKIMSEKEKERNDCFRTLYDMYIKGIKTDDDKKKFDELFERYLDITKTQKNEI